ncbi:MAG: 30S ribosomal protein S13 [Parcubacteria group bacterium GW2011_GWC2_38_7]|nr:MAG: 30S ribosomal protein S13 [Parcubacteria group bacterium GW2011_GWC2_38_7]
MPRIAGINIPNEKRIVIALTYIYGVGLATSEKVLKSLNIDPNIRSKDLPEEQVNILRTAIEKDAKVEGNLRREVLSNIKRLKEIKAYRGVRHYRGLPCRGQKTKTNSRTVRGNVRKTLGSGRTKAQKT